MQMFLPLLLFCLKTIKYIYMNNALNEVFFFFTNNFRSDFFCFEANSQGLETNSFIQYIKELHNSVVT